MIEIDAMHNDEVQETYDLILRVFKRHVAPEYSDGGIARFLGMLSTDVLLQMKDGLGSFVIVAKEGEKIVGMLSLIHYAHIALFFTDSNAMGRGIGRRLIDRCIEICQEGNPSLAAVTVSSSPNAKTFYASAGFEATDSERDEGGMRLTPMRKRLKA